MSATANTEGFPFLLEGVSRLGGAKALIEASAFLIESFKPAELPTDEELLLQQIIRQLLSRSLEERNAAVAILGEQGIDAQQILNDIEGAIQRVDDVNPR